ncbi:MAG: hypothetical protein ACFCUT_06125 [Kiloniellaceae bacterium]
MKITFDKVFFVDTGITSATASNASHFMELRHLIGGNITITFGGHSATYDEACVSDFAVTVAEAIVGYLTMPKPRVKFRSPDFHDTYTIRILGDGGERCEVYRGDELICDDMPLFLILEGARHFLGQVRPLLQERYGHIEHLWDVYHIPVF